MRFYQPSPRPYIKGKLSAEALYCKAVDNMCRRLCEENEKVIVSDPTYACLYAVNILRKRWYKAEPVIMSDSGLLLNYIKHIFFNKKVPEELHNAMLCHYMMDNKNPDCRQYFDMIESYITSYVRPNS
jgi:hypothetical protein